MKKKNWLKSHHVYNLLVMVRKKISNMTTFGKQLKNQIIRNQRSNLRKKLEGTLIVFKKSLCLREQRFSTIYFLLYPGLGTVTLEYIYRSVRRVMGI